MRAAKAFAIVTALLFAAGCAVQPSAPEIKPEADTTGDETDVRVRSRIHTELAAGYFQLGNLSVAIEEVNIALRADPTYAPANNVAGLIYSELKQDRLAEQHFTQAVRLNPRDSDANHNFGWFLCQRKREQEGIKYFLEAVKNPLYRTPERSYLNAGICARQRGDSAAAEGFFKSALEFRPGLPAALHQMAEVLHARGQSAEAKEYLVLFTKVATATPEVLWLGVRVARRMGDANAETSYATQLRNRFPDSREARALLAGQRE